MLARVAQKQQQTMRGEFPEIQQRYATYRELLVTHLALRCYVIDHQRLPDELGELVPGYLSELPVDSFSEGTLSYRQQEEGYVLYSVGPNRVDDGGVESTSAFDGDVILESPWK